MDLSIIIPMFNEAENAEHTLARVEESLASFLGKYEIIAVNDGSTDNTLEVLQGIASLNKRIKVVSYPRNIGRGMALRKGFCEARGEVIVSIDADLSYSPHYILELIKTLKDNPEVDFVLASPYMPGGGVQDVPFVRLWISKLGNKILRLAMPNRIYTSTGIFRAYRRNVLDSLELESDGKEIHLEILSKAMALGFRAKEIPAILTSRKRGSSKFKFKRTATSHLIFSAFEKPMMIFGLIGILTLGIGLLIGAYVVYLRFSGDLTPGRPLITFAILLILGGIQILSFGFIALQILALRKEILRVQKENLYLQKELENLSNGKGKG
ncbi:MAG: glycosyltransferase [Deltaproteobacteria bacterium]|nr:glycosyltransferase [Deltaproteobacteria bacterium]